jgi:sulfur-oxidizing protein SoxZ
MSSIKIRCKYQGTALIVRILIEHPMETGRRRDNATGIMVPAHFITTVQVHHNEKLAVIGTLSTAISRNPYLSIRLQNANPGDRISVLWRDNLGGHDSAEVTLDIDPT